MELEEPEAEDAPELRVADPPSEGEALAAGALVLLGATVLASAAAELESGEFRPLRNEDTGSAADDASADEASAEGAADEEVSASSSSEFELAVLGAGLVAGLVAEASAACATPVLPLLEEVGLTMLSIASFRPLLWPAELEDELAVVVPAAWDAARSTVARTGTKRMVSVSSNVLLRSGSQSQLGLQVGYAG